MRTHASALSARAAAAPCFPTCSHLAVHTSAVRSVEEKRTAHIVNATLEAAIALPSVHTARLCTPSVPHQVNATDPCWTETLLLLLPATVAFPPTVRLTIFDKDKAGADRTLSLGAAATQAHDARVPRMPSRERGVGESARSEPHLEATSCAL